MKIRSQRLQSGQPAIGAQRPTTSARKGGPEQPIRLALIAGFTLLLAACAGGASNPIITASPGRAPAALSATQANPANCATPSVWTTLYTSVVGLDQTGATCITLTTENGISFLAATGLATDSNGYLYIADTFRDRIVVLDQHGNYWSTLNVPNHAPIGVCVAPNGTVGVVTNSDPSDVDFFSSKGPLNGSLNPTNQTAYPTVGRFCAFDHSGDFFVSGESGLPVPIGYLRHNHVNSPNASYHFCNTTICNIAAPGWGSMYSHIMPGNINTLSVENLNVPNIVNFQINDNPPNLLTFVAWSTPITALTNASSGAAGVAPTAGSGNASRIYLTSGTGIDFVHNVVTGGPVHHFAPVAGNAVATNPTGQY